MGTVCCRTMPTEREGSRSGSIMKMMWNICCGLCGHRVSAQLNTYGMLWTDVLQSIFHEHTSRRLWVAVDRLHLQSVCCVKNSLLAAGAVVGASAMEQRGSVMKKPFLGKIMKHEMMIRVLIKQSYMIFKMPRGQNDLLGAFNIKYPQKVIRKSRNTRAASWN